MPISRLRSRILIGLLSKRQETYTGSSASPTLSGMGEGSCFSPEAKWEDPALLEVIYQALEEVAEVSFAAEADEEELAQWINN